MLQAFAKEPAKTSALVLEITPLAIAQDADIVRHLLEQLVLPLRDGLFLHSVLLESLATIFKKANPAFLNAGDLESVLEVIKDRFEQLTQQQKDKRLPLLLALSRLLDAMVDCEVKGLSRIKIHQPLYDRLQALSQDEDKRIAYQAAYATQALVRIPNDETRLRSVLRHTLAAGKGVASLISAVKGLDVKKLGEAFAHFEEVGKGGLSAACRR